MENLKKKWYQAFILHSPAGSVKIGIDNETREQIVRIVVRHSETFMTPPEADAEKMVYDADDLDRLGRMAC